jgi:hypothetical protein
MLFAFGGRCFWKRRPQIRFCRPSPPPRPLRYLTPARCCIVFFILQLVSLALLLLLQLGARCAIQQHAVRLVCFHPTHQPTWTTGWRVLQGSLANASRSFCFRCLAAADIPKGRFGHCSHLSASPQWTYFRVVRSLQPAAPFGMKLVFWTCPGSESHSVMIKLHACPSNFCP